MKTISGATAVAALALILGCVQSSPQAEPPAPTAPAPGDSAATQSADGSAIDPQPAAAGGGQAQPAETGGGEAPTGDPGQAAMCGSRGLAPCPEGMFCDFAKNGCGATDVPGRCEVRPEMCIEIYQPVCGCDGKTYGNACKAHAAGVNESKYCEPETE